jgi:hypothetical protein
MKFSRPSDDTKPTAGESARPTTGGAMGLAALLLALLPAQPAAEAGDYLLVFSAERVPYRPGKAHTFAAVVHVEEGPGGCPRVADLCSLSWLPATLEVRVWAALPEAGRNVPLGETLARSLADGRRVCLWGPYRVRPELAEAFRSRVAAVEAGFAYHGACFFFPRKVCDCARAVEETVAPSRRYIGAFGYGAAAASVIVQEFSPWVIEPGCSHPEVGTLLGLDGWPLIYRPFGDFTSRRDQLGASFRRR